MAPSRQYLVGAWWYPAKLDISLARGMETVVPVVWDHYGDSGELDVALVVMAIKYVLRARGEKVKQIVMQDTLLDHIVMDRRASRIQDSMAREEILKVVSGQVVAEAMQWLLWARHRVFRHQSLLPTSSLVQTSLGSMVGSKNTPGRSSPSSVMTNLTTVVDSQMDLPETFQQIQKSPLDPVLCNALVVQGPLGSPPLEAEGDQCKHLEEYWCAVKTLATRFCRPD